MNYKGKALTIAGSDSGGGAGIQADLKTFHSFGIYGLSVLTSVTAQNTLGVHAIYDLPASIVAAQIDAVIKDIEVDAVKTGMISNREIIGTIVNRIKKYEISQLVVDPVMVAKSGDRLLKKDAEKVFLKRKVGNKAAAEFIANQRHETKLYYKYKAYYGYVFYIGKKLNNKNI